MTLKFQEINKTVKTNNPHEAKIMQNYEIIKILKETAQNLNDLINQTSRAHILKMNERNTYLTRS